MPRRIAIVHAGLQRGENYGVYVQHIETLRWLFDGDPEWEIVPLELFDRAFPDGVLAADLVVLAMTPAPEVEAVIRLRRERSLPTVFEISDNVLALGGWLGRGHLLRSPLVRQNILFHASRCDALQLYAPGLAELFRSVNPNIALFDPYVPIEPLPVKPPGFVVGWGGTTTHRDDLAVVAPVLTSFCNRHRDATFAFMGARDLFDELFAGIAPEQKRHRPFSTFRDYLDFCRGLHAGVAPLRPTPFNAARTDTKFVTFAATGAIALLEDAPPYRAHADHARLFATPDELETHLEALYADRDAMRDLARRAYAWACEHRGRDVLRAQRERLYRSLSPLRGERDAPKAPGEGRCLQDGSPHPPLRGTFSPQSGEKDLQETVAVCRELLRETPDYPQVQWLLARTLESLGRRDEALAFAASIEPHPLYADLFAELRARLDPQYAGRVVSPLRRLRLQYRDAADKLSYYRAVLREQPYDFFALSTVIRLLSRTAPDSPELDELYARAALVDPESVPPARRPRHLEGYLPT